MQLIDGQYFKVAELLRSQTAERCGIDNTPTDDEIIDNINYTIRRLDEIREGYGKPIIINSGYRCPELNRKVGGVSSSFHQLGLAVDIRWDSDLFAYLQQYCSFHKLLRETSKKGVRWIHLSFQRNKKDEGNIVSYINNA